MFEELRLHLDSTTAPGIMKDAVLATLFNGNYTTFFPGFGRIPFLEELKKEMAVVYRLGESHFPQLHADVLSRETKPGVAYNNRVGRFISALCSWAEVKILLTAEQWLSEQGLQTDVLVHDGLMVRVNRGCLTEIPLQTRRIPGLQTNQHQ